MAFAFDTLGYAKRLREAGVPDKQAEAHAEAARDHIMAELVKKLDLEAAVRAQAVEIKCDMTVRIAGLLMVTVAILGALARLT